MQVKRTSTDGAHKPSHNQFNIIKIINIKILLKV